MIQITCYVLYDKVARNGAMAKTSCKILMGRIPWTPQNIDIFTIQVRHFQIQIYLETITAFSFTHRNLFYYSCRNFFKFGHAIEGKQQTVNIENFVQIF